MGEPAFRGRLKSLERIKLVVMFLKSGHLTVAQFKGHQIKAYVRAENGHGAYLAVVAEGVPYPRIIALILDCVPGVAEEDWQPEPSPIAEMKPASGEVIWSTLLPPEAAAEILRLSESL